MPNKVNKLYAQDKRIGIVGKGWGMEWNSKITTRSHQNNNSESSWRCVPHEVKDFPEIQF